MLHLKHMYSLKKLQHTRERRGVEEQCEHENIVVQTSKENHSEEFITDKSASSTSSHKNVNTTHI